MKRSRWSGGATMGSTTAQSTDDIPVDPGGRGGWEGGGRSGVAVSRYLEYLPGLRPSVERAP